MPQQWTSLTKPPLQQRAARPFAGAPGWQVGQAPPPEAPPQTTTEVVEVPNEQTDQGFYQQLVDLLGEVLRELRERRQQGYVYADTISVNQGPPVIIRFEPPLFAISITNDGAGNVQVRIPNRGVQWGTIVAGEEIRAAFETGVIAEMALQTTGAAAASVRVRGTY